MRTPSRDLLVPHYGDGQWYVGGLLDQYRNPGGQWRVVVTYSTGPGATYVLGLPASACRRIDDPNITGTSIITTASPD